LTDEITAVDDFGVFLAKKLLNMSSIASNMGTLSSTQLEALERIFVNAKRYVRDTGIGIDLKASNLYWNGNDWVLFDAGPRMGFRPYGFTLDVPTFKDFMRIWMEFDPPVPSFGKNKTLLEMEATLAVRANSSNAAVESDSDLSHFFSIPQYERLREYGLKHKLNIRISGLSTRLSKRNIEFAIQSGAVGDEIIAKAYALGSEKSLLREPRMEVQGYKATDGMISVEFEKMDGKDFAPEEYYLIRKEINEVIGDFRDSDFAAFRMPRKPIWTINAAKDCPPLAGRETVLLTDASCGNLLRQR
jgi:hypothetical protein